MEKRRDWKRPVVALAAMGALTVAALAAPASAHLGSFSHLKSHIKKIAKKEAKKLLQAPSTLNTFIEESELERFGPINLNLDQTQTIGTFGAGSFTLTASCNNNAGDTQGLIEITTSRDNSAFETDDEGEDDFDTGETLEWAEDTGDLVNVGLQNIAGEDDGYGHAWSPNGIVLEGGGTTIVTNASNGFDCSIGGALLVVAPGA
jgi:hypothetical protein